MVEAVLDEAGIARSSLDVIACDRGPGSFTGIRIGVGVAQGIAMGLDRPVVGVSSLLALAELFGEEAVTPVLPRLIRRLSSSHRVICEDLRLRSEIEHGARCELPHMPHSEANLRE
jgi:tRNA threonylcarbamoyl adenosine modification protein YeaZ